MKTIWKYLLPLQERPSIDMPEGAEILSVQFQREVLTMWALVDPSKPLKARHFEIAGTGFELRDLPRRHIATVQTESQNLVWHIFEAV